MKVARAFRNLLRTVWHDPLWAQRMLIAAPFLLFWPLVGGFLFLALLTLAGFALADQLAVPHSLWNHVAHAGVVLVVLALAWRMLTEPLLVRFGDIEEDAHGSACFARRKELGDLLGAKGLLIGRDEKGRLLRYAGPAHLLTMAPTRSGKGVGTLIPNLLTAKRSVICICKGPQS